MRLSLIPVVLVPPVLLAVPALMREDPQAQGDVALDPARVSVVVTSEARHLEGVRLPAAPLPSDPEVPSAAAPPPALALVHWPQWARSMGDWDAPRLAAEAERRESQAHALARELCAPHWDGPRSMPDDGRDPETEGVVLRRAGRRMVLGRDEAPEVFVLLEQVRFLEERAVERAAQVPH